MYHHPPLAASHLTALPPMISINIHDSNSQGLTGTSQKWLSLNGKFTLSDDSHGIAQVGTNYGRALDFLSSLNVNTVWTLRRELQDADSATGKTARANPTEVSVPLDEIRHIVSKWS